MKNLHIAIIFSLVCAGCIIIPIPIPEHAADYSDRAPIGEESLGFLEVGSTKREEVLLALGIPEWTPEFEGAFHYRWKTKYGTVVFILLLGSGGDRKYTSYKGYQLVIEFDDTGIVKRFEIKEDAWHTDEKLF